MYDPIYRGKKKKKKPSPQEEQKYHDIVVLSTSNTQTKKIIKDDYQKRDKLHIKHAITYLAKFLKC